MPGGDELVGRVIGGRYTITGFLTEGGMGAVYRGTCADEPDGVAIKVMSASLAANADFVRRFHREARTITRIKHRSTVRVVDHGIDGGLPFIVMELVRGTELRAVLEHEKRLTEARAVRIVAQVTSALAAAHDLGVVHRDLKPDNVMVFRDADDPSQERVKVLDFGIAKIMTPELMPADALPVASDALAPSSNAPELTKLGTLIGTPEYMAPEQFRGDPIDGRTDVYACGLLLHRMVTGVVPLADDDWIETSRLRTQVESAPRLASLVPDTHPALDELVAAALERDPSRRVASARAMNERLVAMLPDLSRGLRAMRSPTVTSIPAAPAAEAAAWYAQTMPSAGGELTPAGNEAVTRILGGASAVDAGRSRGDVAVALSQAEQQRPLPSWAADTAPLDATLPPDVALDSGVSSPPSSDVDSGPESLPMNVVDGHGWHAGRVVIRRIEEGGTTSAGSAPSVASGTPGGARAAAFVAMALALLVAGGLALLLSR